jgi:hypothetical protein
MKSTEYACSSDESSDKILNAYSAIQRKSIYFTGARKFKLGGHVFD